MLNKEGCYLKIKISCDSRLKSIVILRLKILVLNSRLN